MHNYFLFKVYLKSKVLFYISILFVVSQLFFTYKGVETFPFIHYGMYSELNQFSDTVTIVEIHNKINNQKMNIDKLRLLNYLEYKSKGDPLLNVFEKRLKFIKGTSIYNYLKIRLINTEFNLKNINQIPISNYKIRRVIIN
jgi:hypothetical protein